MDQNLNSFPVVCEQISCQPSDVKFGQSKRSEPVLEELAIIIDKKNGQEFQNLLSKKEHHSVT